MNQVNAVGANFVPITASQFTLTTSVTGNGRVTSAPAGIDCGSSCSASFNTGSSVTLTATPDVGQVFSGWAGACAGTQTTCLLQISQARTVQATFVVAPPVAAAWQTAALLENSNDFNVAATNRFSDANILTAIGPNGHAMVIWEQSDGEPDGNTIKVFSRRYDPATGWQANTRVATLSMGGFGLVNGFLLMDGSGVATWIRANKETRRSTPATGWGSAFLIPAVIQNSFDPGTLATAIITDNGNISVLLSGSDVYTSMLIAGQQQWSTFARIDASGALAAADARVAASNNGTALTIWFEQNPGDNNYSVKAARYTPSTGWGTPEAIENLLTRVESGSGKVAIDAQGNGIAIWSQGNALYHNIYRVGSGWQGAVAVDAGQLDTTQTRTRLVMTPDGRAVAMWTSALNTLRSMQYSPATGWTVPVTVDTAGTDLKLAIADSGLATLVYPGAINPITANFDVASRSLTFGGQWSAATSLESGAGNVKNSSFSMNRSGQGIAVWAQDDVANSTVRNSLWGAVLR